MYKIFSQNKTIIIASDATITTDKVIAYTNSKTLFKDYLSFINDGISNTLLIKDDNILNVWNEFQGLFKLIEAAGGVVKNEKDSTLMIFRHDRWDLPKGKIEKNEEIDTAALREVEEECGIQNISIVNPLKTTFHTYIMDNKHILKKTYWFLMNYSGTESKLTPQLEEGITEVKWMSKGDIQQVSDNTYPLIKDVLSNVYH